MSEDRAESLDDLFEKYIKPRAEPTLYAEDRATAALQVIQRARAREANSTRPDIVARKEALVAWQLLTADLMSYLAEAPGVGSMPEQQAIRRQMLWSTSGVSPLDEPADLCPVLLPRALFEKLDEAFAAIEAGETPELFKPAVTGRHGRAYAWQEARVRALEWVHVLWDEHLTMTKMCTPGSGLTKQQALEEVARATGVASETLRDWQKELGGRAEVRLRLESAASAGQIFRCRQAELPTSHLTQFDDAAVHKLQELLAGKEEFSEALAAFGERYDAEFGSRHWTGGNSAKSPPFRKPKK